MGVLGLKSFLEREKQTRTINIVNEINKWISEHGTAPSIIIDLNNLIISHSKLEYDTLCGGRNRSALESFEKFLKVLSAIENISLIFFCGLTIQKDKVAEWLSRRNQEFNSYTSLYYLINDGKNIDAAIADNKLLNSTLLGMETIAKKYGDFHYTVKVECDLEIAKYAKNNDVMAVISNNMDFLLFDGLWRLWSSDDIRITAANQLKTTEYERNIAQICKLKSYQLPLFGTLLGNDFTMKFYDNLVDFHNSLGPIMYKIRCVARYVRNVGNVELCDDDIEEISMKVFGNADCNKKQLIRTSVNSYNVDVSPTTDDDPLEKKLFHTDMYRSYAVNMSTIQGINLPFYDMRGCRHDANLTTILADWMKRRIGILRQHNQNNSFTFTLLAMMDAEEEFEAHFAKPIYPDFPVPALDTFYIENEITEINWKMLGWIMSLSDTELALIRKLPKDFLVISSTLYILVKKGLIGAEEADGILYTEKIVRNSETIDMKYPTGFESKCVRAAHIYNITYSHVQENFAIAGLLSLVQDSILQFDGVYYQKLMEDFAKINPTERSNAIKDYRIYA
ncbi:uncharacterized protein LOC116347044 [Contarinia nasturtii]|uniref:uncharacterized protein LOC116347044 n=1 Tax=Contarinia nasturtii TaxID=265458 RepID=UPI0012D437EA|nr:uncharacterized protein LOC116347044 [Contarinia nasturtii]